LINNISSSPSNREKTGVNDESGQEIVSKGQAMQQLIEDQVKILLSNIDININEINKHLSQRSDSDYRFSANNNANNPHSSSHSPSRNRHSSSVSPSRGEILPRHSISDSSGGTSDEKEQRRGSRTINGRNLEDYIENDDENEEENYNDDGNEEEEEGYSHNESDHNLNLKVDFVENSL
jgi:hypothetical protein